MLCSNSELNDLRAMKTFSSGARTNCMVFWAKRPMYSSIALSVISSYALLNSAIRILRSTSEEIRVIFNFVFQLWARLTNHDHERKDVVKNNAKGRSKVIESRKVW